jgi:hypothetical protein
VILLGQSLIGQLNAYASASQPLTRYAFLISASDASLPTVH